MCRNSLSLAGYKTLTYPLQKDSVLLNIATPQYIKASSASENSPSKANIPISYMMAAPPGSDHIQVHLRIRPFLLSEPSDQTSLDSVSVSPAQVVVRKEFTSKAFQVSSVLEEGCSQEDVYQTAGKDVVQVTPK